MTVTKLSDAQVRNLKPQASRYTVWEDGRNGFGVRVTPNGTKTFVYKYRFQGKVQWLTIGTYPAMTLAQAHKGHAEAREMLQRGQNPGDKAVAERQEARKAPTVATLANEYLERWAKPRKRSWGEDKRILEKDIIPAWGTLKAREITKRDVIRLLDEIKDRGAPIMANRTLAVIRKMFNFAVSRDIVPISPCQGIGAPSQENRRDRVLSPDEIKDFWHVLEAAPMAEGIKLALKLQLVTGQRKGEIVSADWSEIDLTENVWTIPKEKSKNGLPHRVPLSPLALELLGQAQDLAGDSPWLFPSPRTGRRMTPEAIDHALRRVCLKHLGFVFVPHDLRRTAASHMTGMGISRLVVSKILNHVEQGITAVYDRHSYDREKREALEAWSRKLTSIIEEESENKVVAFKRY